MAKRRRGETTTDSEATAPTRRSELRIALPWYEGTLLWGSIGLCAALVLAVIAVERDLRWLLIPAWLFACLAAWAAFRSVQPPRIAWLLIVGFSAIAAGGLILVSVKVVTYVARIRESNALGSRSNPLTDAPENLMQIYKGRTDLQGDKLAEAYIGKWIAVSGDVSNIVDVGILPFLSRTMVMFMDKSNHVVGMTFDGKADELRLLRPSSHIKVVGRIKTIQETSVQIEDCELIEP